MMCVITTKNFTIDLEPTNYEFSKRKINTDEFAIQVWSSKSNAELFLKKYNSSGEFKIFECEKSQLIELIKKKYGAVKIELDAK